MTEILAAVKLLWTHMGYELNALPTPQEVAAFEQLHGLRLPADVADYFTTLNGLRERDWSPYDDHRISFWPFSEVRPLAEYWRHLTVPAQGWFVFADYLIDSHVYAVQLTSSAAPVAIVYDEAPIQVAESFRAFLQEYVRGNPKVLLPHR